jgi:oligopeptide/dipeptide ABC transporter ATP-binding protein
VPRKGASAERQGLHVIEARGITKTFGGRGGLLGTQPVAALRGVDFVLPSGGAVSFIGESGCGKTTLGRILCGMEQVDSGQLLVGGTDLARLPQRERAALLRRVQMVHQDPYSALNPTRTVRQVLEDPLALRARQLRRGRDWVESRAVELLGLVGLDPAYCLSLYPHTLSGGMRQRLVIARALTVDPDVLVADEAIAMIDVSLRLGILALLRQLRSELGVSVLFITHDVAAARYVGADGQLYVLYRGQVVEHGPVDAVISSPMHPYTQCLLSAIPVLRGLEEPAAEQLMPIAGLDAGHEPPGCLFADRCPNAEDDCALSRPTLRDAKEPGHRHACLHPRPRQVVAVPLAPDARPSGPS